jgi:hypothetical protein
LVPGVTYESVSKLMKNRKEGNVISTICASLICPIINTGIFVLGCLLFFYTDIAQVAADKGMQGNVFGFIIVFYVTFNFIFELILNIVASPTVIKILKVTKKI